MHCKKLKPVEDPSSAKSSGRLLEGGLSRCFLDKNISGAKNAPYPELAESKAQLQTHCGLTNMLTDKRKLLSTPRACDVG